MSICYESPEGVKPGCPGGKPFKFIRGPEDGKEGMVCRNGQPDDDSMLKESGIPSVEPDYREDILVLDPKARTGDGKPVYHEYRLVDEKAGTYIHTGVVEQ